MLVTLERLGKNCHNMLSRFHPIPGRYGQTDRRTVGQNYCYINIARHCVLTGDKTPKSELAERDPVAHD